MGTKTKSMVDITTIILAAGDGTRMRSTLPKLLHPVAGLPIVGHVVRAAKNAGSNIIVGVTAPNQIDVQDLLHSIAPDIQIFEQTERLGTAHAAQTARPAWHEADGYIAVVYGDHPLLHGDIFIRVFEQLDAGWDACILGFQPDDPTGYGRFIVQGDHLLDIVEHKDASEEQKNITLCNACILAFKADAFRQTIDLVKNENVQAEYYLTDMVKLANQSGLKVSYVLAPEEDVMGVNSRAQLAVAEGLFQQRLRRNAMGNGVTLRDPQTTYFSFDTEIGRDVTIEPGVVFGPGVTIQDNVQIKAYSHIEGATIASGAIVGPFARLRPGTDLGENSKVGNFCEVKNAQIGQGAKVNHLSYVGDATIGANANVGAGTITCNYDGFNKSHTEIGEGAFVGSNTALVAPVRIGAGAIVAAGSTIVRDVAADELALTRVEQSNRQGYAPKLRSRALAKKNKNSKKQG